MSNILMKHYASNPKKEIANTKGKKREHKGLQMAEAVHFVLPTYKFFGCTEEMSNWGSIAVYE